MDIDEMQAEIIVATDEALASAHMLAAEIIGLRVSRHAARMATEFEEKFAYIRRLRRAVKAEIAG